MNSDKHNQDVVELGAISEETKGVGFIAEDQEAGLRVLAGLSDD